jgi:hypothetical protein
MKTEITPEKALAEFDVTEAALAEIKTYEKVEIQDSKSEAVVRKYRQEVRTLRTDVEKKRKDLKAPAIAYGKLIDKTAKELTARLLPTETILDEKVKAVEAVAEAKRAEKMAAEKIRTDAIQEELAKLTARINAGLEANLPSSKIKESLDWLIWESEEPKEEIYQEFTDTAKDTILKGIESATAYLERTEKWEAEKKAQEELAAKNKAEAERLAKIAKEQEEAQNKAKAERDKAEAEAKAKLDAEVEKIEKSRREFEDEKAKQVASEHMILLAQKKRIADLERREQELEWSEYAASLTFAWINEAYQINEAIHKEEIEMQERCKEAYDLQMSRSWDEAQEMKRVADENLKIVYSMDWEIAHAHNDDINLELEVAMVAEIKRIEALKPDREKLLAFADKVELFEDPELKTLGTDEAWAIFHSAKEMLKSVATAIRMNVEAL